MSVALLELISGVISGFLGGRECTEQECRESFQYAGFRRARIIATSSMVSIGEGVPA